MATHDPGAGAGAGAGVAAVNCAVWAAAMAVNLVRIVELLVKPGDGLGSMSSPIFQHRMRTKNGTWLSGEHSETVNAFALLLYPAELFRLSVGRKSDSNR